MTRTRRRDEAGTAAPLPRPVIRLRQCRGTSPPGQKLRAVALEERTEREHAGLGAVAAAPATAPASPSRAPMPAPTIAPMPRKAVPRTVTSRKPSRHQAPVVCAPDTAIHLRRARLRHHAAVAARRTRVVRSLARPPLVRKEAEHGVFWSRSPTRICRWRSRWGRTSARPPTATTSTREPRDRRAQGRRQGQAPPAPRWSGRAQLGLRPGICASFRPFRLGSGQRAAASARSPVLRRYGWQFGRPLRKFGR